MNEHEQKAILTLSLMAAFADGNKDESERAELKRIADALAGEASINLAALYQDVLLKRVSMPSAVAALTSPEARQLAFEMAVCVCDADGVQSPAEQAFLADLRHALALDVQQSAAYTRQAEAIAALPVGASATDSAVDEAPAAPVFAVAEHASTMSEAEMEKAILNAAILNGALELLPESLSTMAIIPLQMKLVYRIGKSYGFELDRGHIKDFLATLGMPFTPDLVDELNTLVHFDLASTQQGIKIHKTAAPAIIAATQRLHSKGLLTQIDGGYLTSLGRDAAEHVQAALTILTSLPASSKD
uniref:TIGR02647 family protein n=2 Tax=Accumulibacter sp. TaxID=2053492 RepID=UPI0025C0E944|nr:TIGR02647 family protein [Accumulibacter sp.]